MVAATTDRPADHHAEATHSVGGVSERLAVRLATTGHWLPLWVAVTTVFAFLISPAEDPLESAQRLGVILVGLAWGALAWTAGALVTNEAVLACRANRRSHADLRMRVEDLLRELDQLLTIRPAADQQDLRAVRDAVTRLQERLCTNKADSEWSDGYGYVSAWRELHGFEVGLLAYVPPERLRTELLRDELRVENSKLDQKGSLTRAEIEGLHRRFGWDTRTRTPTKPDSDQELEDVRGALQRIRTAVNDFRDRRYEALARQRESVNRTSALLGMTAWAVLAVAILVDAELVQVARVAAFYLIGAAAGLFLRLQSDSGAAALEDGYGLQQAQTRQTMLMSGLAGIAGVILTQTVAGGTAGEDNVIGFLRAEPYLFAVAAGFGLAPAVLVERLGALAKTQLRDLESTQPSATRN